MKRPPVDVDLRPFFEGEERGTANKELIVCHETVSFNRVGLGDITGVAAFMDSRQLEIHGIIDVEGHTAWSVNEQKAIYDHAASGSGNVNTRGIGFELVSEIPFLKTPALRREAWRARQRRKQLDKLAWWCAWLHGTEGIPLRYSDSDQPGITTHWDVSREWLGGHGHWDCWPIHKGGHFPVLYVVRKAQQLWEAQSGL
jgi:hypothetical protein